VAPSSCPYGYNFNVILDYTVTFSGAGAPASLYTLQGNLTCGSKSLFYNLPNSGGSGTYTTTTNPYLSTTNCATATTTSLGCNSSTLQIGGPGISDRTVTCTGTPLPIELIEFKSIKTVNGVLIKWVTASEINNDYFTIERSSNAEEWEIIGTVKGAGNSNQNNDYTFIDRIPLKSDSYYQIKQTDFDGTTTYSYISSVDENKVSTTLNLAVYPNPSDNMISIEGEIEEISNMTIFSALGENVSNFTQFNQQSETIIQCDISNLQKGVYFIRTKSSIKKFVKV
jgi:hypothetical protein